MNKNEIKQKLIEKNSFLLKKREAQKKLESELLIMNYENKIKEINKDLQESLV